MAFHDQYEDEDDDPGILADLAIDGVLSLAKGFVCVVIIFYVFLT